MIASWILAFALATSAADSRQLLKLIDYLGADYSMAVEKGQVRSEAEYEELKQFHALASERLEDALEGANDAQAASLREDLRALGTMLESKADASRFEALARKIREATLERFAIPAFPAAPPSFDRGKTLYRENCAICHGDRGDGQGAVAATLDPPPASFIDPERIGGISPFRAFNVTTLGVENTSMPSFRALEDSERWDLAYYLFTMRHPHGSEIEPPGGAKEDWQSLADRTDEEILAVLRAKSPNSDPLPGLAWLRSLRSYDAGDTLSLSLRFLEEAAQAASANRAEAVRDALTAAYLDGVEPVEPKLRVLAPGAVERIEEGFQKVRRLASREAPTETLRTEIANLAEEIRLSRRALEKTNENSGAMAFWQSFLIIVREGIEAALLVGAILGLLRAGGDRRAARFVHWGWILAIAAGFGLWWLSRGLIQVSGAGREIVEGVAALLAAAVLFYVSYWLLSKYDSAKWMQFLKVRVENSLARGSLLTLFGLSFIAVFRESLETVLFYQALLEGSQGAELRIVAGFVAGCGLLLLLLWAMFRLGLRLPLRQFFLVSGMLLYLLAFVMAGKGIWALQEAGTIGITPIDAPRLPWIGFFPTLEGALVQGIFVAAVALGAVWFFARRARASAA